MGKVKIDFRFSYDSIMDGIDEAIGKCKDGFTVDDILNNIELINAGEDENLLEDLISLRLPELIKEGYLVGDDINCVYRFAGDWK